MVVDDFLPFWGSTGNNLLFDFVNPGEGIWAAVLEKAWAKVSGNYDIISGGWMQEAVGFLTGAPSTQYNTNIAPISGNALNAWNIINAFDQS